MIDMILEQNTFSDKLTALKIFWKLLLVLKYNPLYVLKFGISGSKLEAL